MVQSGSSAPALNVSVNREIGFLGRRKSEERMKKAKKKFLALALVPATILMNASSMMPAVMHAEEDSGTPQPETAPSVQQTQAPAPEPAEAPAAQDPGTVSSTADPVPEGDPEPSTSDADSSPEPSQEPSSEQSSETSSSNSDSSDTTSSSSESSSSGSSDSSSNTSSSGLASSSENSSSTSSSQSSSSTSSSEEESGSETPGSSASLNALEKITVDTKKFTEPTGEGNVRTIVFKPTPLGKDSSREGQITIQPKKDYLIDRAVRNGEPVTLERNESDNCAQMTVQPGTYVILFKNTKDKTANPQQLILYIRQPKLEDSFTNLKASISPKTLTYNGKAQKLYTFNKDLIQANENTNLGDEAEHISANVEQVTGVNAGKYSSQVTLSLNGFESAVISPGTATISRYSTTAEIGELQSTADLTSVTGSNVMVLPDFGHLTNSSANLMTIKFKATDIPECAKADVKFTGSDGSEISYLSWENNEVKLNIDEVPNTIERITVTARLQPSSPEKKADFDKNISKTKATKTFTIMRSGEPKEINGLVFDAYGNGHVYGQLDKDSATGSPADLILPLTGTAGSDPYDLDMTVTDQSGKVRFDSSQMFEVAIDENHHLQFKVNDEKKLLAAFATVTPDEKSNLRVLKFTLTAKPKTTTGETTIMYENCKTTVSGTIRMPKQIESRMFTTLNSYRGLTVGGNSFRWYNINEPAGAKGLQLESTGLIGTVDQAFANKLEFTGGTPGGTEASQIIFYKDDSSSDAKLSWTNIEYLLDNELPVITEINWQNLGDAASDDRTSTTKEQITAELKIAEKISGIEKIQYAWAQSKDDVTEWADVAYTQKEADMDKNAVVSITVPAPKEQSKLYVRVTDVAGNVYQKEDDQSIILDTETPTLTVSAKNGSSLLEPSGDGKIYLATDAKDTVEITVTDNAISRGRLKIWAVSQEGKEVSIVDGPVSKLKDDNLSVSAENNRLTYTLSMEQLSQLTNQALNLYVSFTDESTSPVEDMKSLYLTGTVSDYVVEPAVQTVEKEGSNEVKLTATGKHVDPNRLTVKLDGVEVRKVSWTLEPTKTKDGKDVYSCELFTEQGTAAVHDIKLEAISVRGVQSEATLSAHLVDWDKPYIEEIKVKDAYRWEDNPGASSMAGREYYFRLGEGSDSKIVEVTATDPSSAIHKIELTYVEDGSKVRHQAKATSATITDNTDSLLGHHQKTETFEMGIAGKNIKIGSLQANAVDSRGNASGFTDPGNDMIINDIVSPNLTVSYDKEKYLTHDTTKDNQYYRNPDDLYVTLTIVEKNFYKEDVKLEVYSGHEKAAIVINPDLISWTDSEDGETHIARINPAELFAKSNPNNNTNGSWDDLYQINVEYTDRSGNAPVKYKSPALILDTTAPVLSVIYVAGADPVNTLQDSQGHMREYYDYDRDMEMILTDANVAFDSNKAVIQEGLKMTLTAQDADGADLPNPEKTVYSESGWSQTTSDTYVNTYKFSGDANYALTVSSYVDLAGNMATFKDAQNIPMTERMTDYFTVDKTAPTNLNISYSKSVLDTVLEGITFGFYQAPVTATITATDNISSIHSFDYSMLKAAGVSDVNAQSSVGNVISEEQFNKSDSLKTRTASFQIPAGTLQAGNEFNGTVDFTAYNRAEESEDLDDSDNKRRIVVDNIAPNINVSFTGTDKRDGEASYYNTEPTVTIDITEANFYPEDVHFNVTCDGAGVGVNPSWSSSGDTHHATWTFSQEGKYSGTITYTDKSGNTMATYTFDTFVVDKTEPSITVGVNNKTSKDGILQAFWEKDLQPVIHVEDDYIDSGSVKGSYSRYLWNDVTDEELKANENKKSGVKEDTLDEQADVNGTTVEYVLDKISDEADGDGIYTLKGSATDKAGNSAEDSMTFIVSRYGAVYVLDDYLQNQLAGQAVSEITDDLVVHEFVPLQYDESNHDTAITLLRSGELFDTGDVELSDINKHEFESKENPVTAALINNSDQKMWNAYTHTVSKDIFTQKVEGAQENIEADTQDEASSEAVAQTVQKDGRYSVSIETSLKLTNGNESGESSSTYDQFANRFNENHKDAANQLPDLNFVLDSKAPVIENVQGLEEDLYGEENHLVTMKVSDEYGLEKVDVYVDDELVKDQSYQRQEGDTEAKLEQTITLELPESRTPHKIQVSAEDRAKNKVNTEKLNLAVPEEAAIKPYFKKTITVSRDRLVRWRNNKPLFYGSIAAVIAAISGGIYAFYKKKFKDSDDEEENSKKDK